MGYFAEETRKAAAVGKEVKKENHKKRAREASPVECAPKKPRLASTAAVSNNRSTYGACRGKKTER